MGAVGMAVEGPTDGAAEVGQGAAEMAAEGSTDMGGGCRRAGGPGREGSAGQHRAGRMAGMSQNQRKRLKKLARRGRDG